MVWFLSDRHSHQGRSKRILTKVKTSFRGGGRLRENISTPTETWRRKKWRKRQDATQEIVGKRRSFRVGYLVIITNIPQIIAISEIKSNFTLLNWVVFSVIS